MHKEFKEDSFINPNHYGMTTGEILAFEYQIQQTGTFFGTGRSVEGLVKLAKSNLKSASGAGTDYYGRKWDIESRRLSLHEAERLISHVTEYIEGYEPSLRSSTLIDIPILQRKAQKIRQKLSRS